jgi:adenylate cyclase
MKRLLIVSLIALVISILHSQIFSSRIGERVEPWIADVWFNLRGVEAAPPEVAVIAMDESSYRNLNIPLDRAWPRSMHAKLLKRLQELGVKRVLFDIIFQGPSSDPKADQELADAFKLLPSVIGTELITKDMGGSGGSYVIEELILPLESFEKNVESLALAKMPEEFDFIRKFHLERSQASKDIPTLYEAAVPVKPRDPGLPGPRDMIWYYGGRGSIDTIPYHQILNPDGKIPKDVLKDKTVFVGLSMMTETGPAQKDSFRSSFDSDQKIFGVEILATAAANLIEHKWIKRLGVWTEGIIYFFLCFALCVALFILKPQWSGLVLGVSIILWLIISFVSFINGLFLPGVLLFFFFLPTAFLGSVIVYYLITYRSQQQVEKAFQFYVSPEMAHQMRDNPNALSLGGENVFATALFTDIAGFSEITEKMNATEVSNMLNAYFTEVMNEIFEKKGTLIKFIGDAVFALWGVPIKVADHAKLACQAALAIQKSVDRFNASKKFPPLHTRIGVNTGPMLVGNLGSARRFDYTGIGDSVNLASRVEGINKYFGTGVLITESTRKEMGGGDLNTLSIGTIQVAGKKEGVELHVLLDNKLPRPLEDAWLQALILFRTKKWGDAKEAFTALQSKDKFFEKPCGLYLKAIQQYEVTPPDDEWQGEMEFTTK